LTHHEKEQSHAKNYTDTRSRRGSWNSGNCTGRGPWLW
jgi:hypothetical protein